MFWKEDVISLDEMIMVFGKCCWFMRGIGIVIRVEEEVN